uniref:Uncharacterized protein n=1 Tax=Vombatus ursinus TaxID=29139 RepID=A0A4X2KB79_VOMUR
MHWHHFSNLKTALISLSDVQNKNTFLCGVMTHRLVYTIDVTTGQRKYGGPPLDSLYICGEKRGSQQQRGHRT